MSFNHNFYNNHRSGFTFQNFRPRYIVPPPPHPPLFLIPPAPIPPDHSISDVTFVKNFEKRVPMKHIDKKPKSLSISEIRDTLKALVINLDELKVKETELCEKIKTCNNDEWNTMLDEINYKKELINKRLSNISNSHLNVLHKLIVKRSAKRMRLKRLHLEKKRLKEDKIKELEEKSRKIDENLMKIKNDIIKVKQVYFFIDTLLL
jgi:hypothetical protein